MTIKDRYIIWLNGKEYTEEGFNKYWAGFLEAVNNLRSETMQ